MIQWDEGSNMSKPEKIIQSKLLDMMKTQGTVFLELHHTLRHWYRLSLLTLPLISIIAITFGVSMLLRIPVFYRTDPGGFLNFLYTIVYFGALGVTAFSGIEHLYENQRLMRYVMKKNPQTKNTNSINLPTLVSDLARIVESKYWSEKAKTRIGMLFFIFASIFGLFFNVIPAGIAMGNPFLVYGALVAAFASFMLSLIFIGIHQFMKRWDNRIMHFREAVTKLDDMLHPIVDEPENSPTKYLGEPK